MADEPDLVAALISTAGNAAQLANDSYEVGDRLYPVGGEINRIARQLSSFSQILTNASKAVDRKTSCPKGQVREASRSLLRDSRRLLSEARELVNELIVFHADYGKEPDLPERTMEIVVRPEVVVLRMEFDSIRSAFATLILAVDCAEADDHYAPHRIKSALKTQLMNAIRVMEELVSDLLAQCNCEPELDDHEESDVAEASEPKSPQKSAKPKKLSAHQEWLQTYSSSKKRSHPRLRNARLVLRGVKFLSQGNSEMLDLSSQQMVYRLAQAVLRNQTERASWSWSGSHIKTSSSRRRHREQEDVSKESMEDLADQFAAGPSRPVQIRHTTQTLEEEDAKDLTADEAHSALPISSEADDTTTEARLDHLQDPDATDGHADIHGSDSEKDQSDRNSDSGLSDTNSQDNLDIDKYYEQPSSSSSSGKKPLSQSNLNSNQSDSAKYPPKTQCLNFEDAVGRKFIFPWSMVSTWKGMEKLIRQAFLHVDVIGPHVYDGHYDLVSQDGHIILPQIWSSTVQPTWQIKMMMWPFPEPELFPITTQQSPPSPPLPPLFPLPPPPAGNVMPMVPPPAPVAPTTTTMTTTAANSMYILPGVGVLASGFKGKGRKTKLRQR